MMTQIEVEEQMYHGGIARAKASLARNEENGEASRNPYASTLFRDFVAPLAELIRRDVWEATGADLRRAHVPLLRPLDPMAVAYLTVRVVINNLMESDEEGGRRLRGLAYAVGSSVHSELALTVFEEAHPDLYHTLANDFQRRRTKSIRHKMTVFKMQAKGAGLVLPEWGVGSRDQIGLWLLDKLAFLGMVSIDSMTFITSTGEKKGTRNTPYVHMAAEVLEVIGKISSIVEINRPLFGPCVEPPIPWTTPFAGGFHTERMRRRVPCLVRGPAACRELLQGEGIPTVLQAVNALQATSWRVNGRVLQALERASAAGLEFGEVVAQFNPDPKPPKPEWLDETVERTAYQEGVFKEWKGAMRDWYTRTKLRGSSWGRFTSAIQAARTFRDEPHLHFVYFLDTRGRAYPLTFGISPQGSDLQKALIEFSVGKGLPDEAAVEWFLINGANRWGFDKEALAVRAQWSRDRHKLIRAIAADPVSNRDWTQADKPLQFLAWCFEYAAWCDDPNGFLSHLPVALDGSCNGLQHFSAMLRDEVGGEATNLRDKPKMQDIYQRVADTTVQKMKFAHTVEDAIRRTNWILNGVGRSVVKRAVMTTPYGVTKTTATKYVILDYLKPNGIFPATEQRQYAVTLMDYAWDAIGDVVTKSREAMNWLNKSAKAIIKARGDDTEGVLSWRTPSGFLASQAYYEILESRIKVRLLGSTVQIKTLTEGDEASAHRHSMGLAPNFVHSMDASHMHLVAAAAESLGIDALAMIHDDFGTHAADTQKFFMLIRMKFVDMYEANDPIADLHAAYPETPSPPAKGELDIREVLQSDFFFS